MKYILALLLLFPLSAMADLPSQAISWTLPTERVDGSRLSSSEISGYELVITEPDGTETAQQTDQLSITYLPVQIGTHKFCIKTIDTNGLTSSPACASTSLIPPNSPGTVIIITVGN